MFYKQLRGFTLIIIHPTVSGIPHRELLSRVSPLSRIRQAWSPIGPHYRSIRFAIIQQRKNRAARPDGNGNVEWRRKQYMTRHSGDDDCPWCGECFQHRIRVFSREGDKEATRTAKHGEDDSVDSPVAEQAIPLSYCQGEIEHYRIHRKLSPDKVQGDETNRRRAGEEEIHEIKSS